MAEVIHNAGGGGGSFGGLVLDAWAPPEPKDHRLGSYIKSVVTLVAGRKGITVVAVEVCIPMRDFSITADEYSLTSKFVGVARKHTDEPYDEKTGRKVAICDALDQASIALQPEIRKADRAMRKVPLRPHETYHGKWSPLN